MSDENKTMREVEEAIGMVSTSVWRARFTLLVIKPVMFLLGIAMYAAGLYGGTWIVVLALRHSGAIS